MHIRNGTCAHGVRIEMDMRYLYPQSVRWTDADFFASYGTHTHRPDAELMPIFYLLIRSCNSYTRNELTLIFTSSVYHIT